LSIILVLVERDPTVEEWSLPALLRAARRTYGTAIREALAEAGLDDIPRNGIFVIGAIAHTGAPLSEIIEQLGASKQAAGQLVDTLVLRGYLNREVDPDDRRRLRVTLTERGHTAAALIRGAVDHVDRELAATVGDENVARTRATLATLATTHTDA
jgi:DNA-binding MarR family transcriptional regulator